MGLFTKSILVLLIALSTPLLYRHFANDGTIKFMSSYYSNYNTIDSFLKQSAGHIDTASSIVKDEVGKLSVTLKKHIDTLTAPKIRTDDSSSKKNDDSKNHQKKEPVKMPNYRLSSCPGEQTHVRLWTKEELSKYDGNSGETDIYLGFLGLVYNVSVNVQHYGPGAEYSAFSGRDATRAFVTGNFSHDLHDDIRDIDESMYSHIEGWASFYGTSYPFVGRIIGSFFDSQGCGTKELARVYEVFNKLAQEKSAQREQDRDIPECNSEWNSELKQGKVWCSKKSGGIERDWTGVPRIYNDGESQRCICLNQNSPDANNLPLQQYPDCDPNASECSLKQ